MTYSYLYSSTTDYLQVDHISKSFPAATGPVTAVNSVSFCVKQGEIFAFLGPNGAGKTTTIKMIAGLIIPDRGTITVGGLSPHGTRQALKGLGAVLEGNRNLYWRLSPWENLAYFAAIRGVDKRLAQQRGRQLLQQLGLSRKQDDHVQTLSRGMQQKVAIAVALIHAPRLLLLDEPTLGLDVESAQHIKEFIKEFAASGRSVLLTTHQLDLAEQISQRVAIIDQGELVSQGDTADLIKGMSANSYDIWLAEAPAEELVHRLPVDTEIDGNKITIHGETDSLYAALDLLRPSPLTRIERTDANLSSAFLKIIQRRRTNHAAV